MKICYGQFIQTENSQTQILDLKRTIALSKQLPLYKSKLVCSCVPQEQTILFPEDGEKRQKHVLKKNK